ncbi:hypothetical protein HRJ35_07380 [Shewanella oneidensis MR-1]|uniref:Uncharacterized protein n=1 Tax=Shewanella oneidensis (strain ATCC 700550 / JCM 31522 / CIP 106686 / LMG 19005 / NCIMB 14063 / MR-1) TaxID=211586 RepID=Q8EI25_SHEON|nr:hypothetical protein [Shewanella oneidensis]AAN54101.1 uncharacterized protein SO_1028 [Shewanella oneidensis MR-1]MDX5997093.1 hypothetical protein [Shewanella oneidensis]MEE2028010.1 hypothetical protein [Shewanella oneidensis]QKG95850.1 hypothetical protein HRJ35_07380 [Shewanella oneidensis MR-1]
MDFLRDGSVHPAVFFYAIISIGISIVCFLLAKDKRRNTVIAVVTGLVPILNYFALAYYVGITKLDVTEEI